MDCAQPSAAFFCEARPLAPVPKGLSDASDDTGISPAEDCGHQSGRGLPHSESAPRFMALVARAVHYAHGRGVLRRDLKPSNILIDRRSKS